MTKPKLIMAAVESILPSKDNPRIVSDDPAELNSDGLLDSVKAIGVQQPLQVRDHPAESGKKELLAGERRWMCCRVAGVATVMALDYGAMPDDEAFRITCIENAHRKELKPLEQGRAASIALARCNGDVKAAAALLGQTPRWIAMGANIHDGLAKVWKKGLAKEHKLRHWTAGHLALVARFPASVQEDLYKSLVVQGWPEDMSVDALTAKTADILRVLAKAPFAITECGGCRKRSSQQHLLFADDEAEVTGKNERCLDAACFQAKETRAYKQAFVEKAREHRGLVAIDTSKQYDYQRNEQLKKLYGDQLLEQNHHGTPKYEVVKAETKGAIPALVVAGPGKGAVKYVKRIKPATVANSAKKSKADTEAAKGKKQMLLAVRDRIRRDIETVTVDEILANSHYMAGMLFFLVMSGGSGNSLYGKGRTEFLDMMREPAGGNPLPFLYGRVWTLAKESLDDEILADFNLDGHEGPENMQAIARAFGWDYERILSEVQDQIVRDADLAKRTEVVALDLPKNLDAKCELKLLEDGGMWFGGFEVLVPRADLNLPVDTLGESYATKGSCLLTMAQAVKEQLAKLRGEKKCAAALAKEISVELDTIIKACELELQRSGEASKPTTSDESRVTSDAPTVRDGGFIENPELIQVPLDPVWKAKVTIKIAEVDGKWYVGFDAHVPGEAKPMPCSTAHVGWPNRNEALSAVCEDIETWLYGKPGRKGYKHHEGIEMFVRKACQNAATPTGAHCSSDPDACDLGCIPCSGTRKAEDGPPLSSAKSIASGKITSGLEPRANAEDLCSRCDGQRKGTD